MRTAAERVNMSFPLAMLDGKVYSSLRFWRAINESKSGREDRLMSGTLEGFTVVEQREHNTGKRERIGEREKNRNNANGDKRLRLFNLLCEAHGGFYAVCPGQSCLFIGRMHDTATQFISVRGNELVYKCRADKCNGKQLIERIAKGLC